MTLAGEKGTAPDGLLDAVVADLEALERGTLELAAFVERRGGRRSDRVITLSSPIYTERFDRIWTALREAGFDPHAVLNYIAWEKRFAGQVVGPATIGAMDPQDLRFQVVAFVRGERFCDGFWEGLLRNGALLAATRRARDLARSPSA